MTSKSASARKGERQTFRGICNGVAWQKQLRDRYLEEGVPPLSSLSLKSAVVRPISREMAERAILKYEWLGTMSTSTYHYGIFFDRYCAGVTCVCIGSGTGGTNVAVEWGVERSRMAILVRGACVHWAPPGSNSKLVSWTCRLLARDTDAELVIAYADTDAGELGTIYQACGWTYVGRDSATEQWIAPSGRVFDGKLPWNLYNQRGGSRKQWVAALKKAGWRTQKSNRKHRYVRALNTANKDLVARVEAKRQPYPKRSE